MNQNDQAGSAEQILLWVRRLQWRYPTQTKMIVEAKLAAMVQEALSSCKALEIADEKEVFRFVALRVLLTQEQRQSPLIQGVLVRILSNLDWDSKKRLDFIYKHVVGRPVSSDEIDFGKDFAPTF
jgi:hypothetical protein